MHLKTNVASLALPNPKILGSSSIHHASCVPSMSWTVLGTGNIVLAFKELKGLAGKTCLWHLMEYSLRIALLALSTQCCGALEGETVLPEELGKDYRK